VLHVVSVYLFVQRIFTKTYTLDNASFLTKALAAGRKKIFSVHNICLLVFEDTEVLNKIPVAWKNEHRQMGLHMWHVNN